MNPFDQAARYAAKQLDAEGFLRWLLPGAADWRFAGWLDTQTLPFPGEPDRRADVVASFVPVRELGPPVAAVVEIQARPRAELPQRLAEYSLRLRREVVFQTGPRVPYEVVGCLINLTGSAQPETWEMRPAGFGGAGLHFRIVVRTMRDEDAATLLAGVAAGTVTRAMLAWVPLMRGADAPELIEEWKRLASAEPDRRTRGDLAGLAKVFAELADRQDVWKAGLEGWDVEESMVVKEWQEQALAKGLARGLAQGLAEGQSIGAVTATRAKLVRLMEKRFGPSLPADLVAAVNAQTDLATLDRWFDDAITVGLAELRTAVGLSAGG
jgi:hypothetical protein